MTTPLRDQDGSAVPGWLNWVVEPSAFAGSSSLLRRVAATVTRPRAAAVLVLFGGSASPDPQARGGLPTDADVLLTQRAATLREHGGQVAFPGGGADPGDDGPVGTALREAEEETGLDPTGVEPLVLLPTIYVPPSRFNVTPVVAYWRTPSPIGVVDEAEAQRVVRVPIASLIDPANRFQVRHPLGFQGPAFEVDDMLVWGFTGGILADLLASSGWAVEWDETDVRDLAAAVAGRDRR